MKDEDTPNWKWFTKRLLFIFLALLVMALVRGFFKKPEMSPDEKAMATLKAAPKLKAAVESAVDKFAAEQAAKDREKMAKALEAYQHEQAAKKAASGSKTP